MPGSRCLTVDPSAFLSEMVKPGPTTPVSVTLGAWDEPVAAAGMETAAMTSVIMSSLRYMTLLFLRSDPRFGFTQAAVPV